VGKFIKPSMFVDFTVEQSRKISIASKIENDLQSTQNVLDNCDVVVVGGGAAGTAAAIQSARMHVNTCIIEQTDWLGDVLTGSGVSAIDGDPQKTSGIFREFLDRVVNYYRLRNQLNETHQCKVSPFCFEPEIGAAVLNQMVSQIPALHVYFNSYVTKVYRDGNIIKGVRFRTDGGDDYIVPAHVVIDATQFGDVMYMADVPYDIGIDRDSTELHAKVASQCIQPITYVTVLKFAGKDVTIPKPDNYNPDNYKCTISNKLCPKTNSQFDMDRLVTYGLLPNNKLMINVPSHSYGNDYDATDSDLDNFSRNDILKKAKDYSKGYIYFLQKELGFYEYGLSDDFGTDDQFAKLPYVRESRRLVGEYRLQENDVLPDVNGRSKVFTDSIAIGDYPIDLHFCEKGKGDFYYPIPPYQIPYGITIPKDIDGFMLVGQNISVSHIVNGTTRMQPVMMQIGQAVGMGAALSVIDNVEPRNVSIPKLQEKLVSSGSRLLYFSDLNADNFAYQYVTKLALRKILHGYNDLSFKPNNPVNNYDATFMFAKAYNPNDNNLDYGSALNLLKEKNIADQSIDLSDIEQPLTREEMAHLISRFIDPSDNYRSSNQYFVDVNKKNPFRNDIAKLAGMKIISTSQNRFRPGDVVTRAEAVTMLGKALDYSTESSVQ